MDEKQRREWATLIGPERKRQKLTQKQLAEAASLPLSTVQNIERGVSVPQAATLTAAMNALGLDPSAPLVTTETAPTASMPDAGWSPDVAVVLDVVGLCLESLSGSARERCIRQIVEGVLNARETSRTPFTPPNHLIQDRGSRAGH